MPLAYIAYCERDGNFHWQGPYLDWKTARLDVADRNIDNDTGCRWKLGVLLPVRRAALRAGGRKKGE